MITLTDKEADFISGLLNMAADKFGNHGCNDMDPAVIAQCGFTDEEKIAITREFVVDNGDLEEVADFDRESPETQLRRFQGIGDSSWMSFFASKLGGV